MSASSYCYLDALSYRARRTGVAIWTSAAKKGVKKKLNRAGRVNAKGILQRELQDLAATPVHDALLDEQDLPRASFTLSELEEMADRLLSEADTQADQVAEAEGENFSRPLPTELLGGLPDWLLAPMEAANGDAFAYLSLLEGKRPRSTAGLLAEELAEAA